MSDEHRGERALAPAFLGVSAALGIAAHAAAPIEADSSGAHRQSAPDLDGDGLTDMPGYRRLTVRSRLFWSDPDGVSAYLTVGAMTDERPGGTLPGRAAPDGQPSV